MKRYSLLFFIFLSTLMYSQDCEYLLGCDKQKSRRGKELCNSKNFNELYFAELEKMIDKYGGRIPTGKTNIQFTIMKDGSIDKFSYDDFDNEKFAKLALYILIQIAKDLDKYNLKFDPAIDSNTGETTELKFQFPVELKIE